MGKVLIIKGADFSAVAVDTVEPSVEYENITSKLAQGFVTSNGKLYTDKGSNYGNYVTALESGTSYLENSQNVQWFIPNGVFYKAWAVGGSDPTIASPTDTSYNGTIGNGTFTNAQNVSAGNGSWITASDIYTILGVSADNYPMCGLNLSISGTQAVTPSDLIDPNTYGVKVRRVTTQS